MATWTHEILTAPQMTLALLALILVLLVMGAPRLFPLVRVLRGGQAAEMPLSWLEKIRQESRHSAHNAVQEYVSKLGLLERRYDELKAEVGRVVDVVEEMRPLAIEVAKLTTSVEFMREKQGETSQEQSEMREELRDAMSEIRSLVSRKEK